jgi:hypothetical protein
MKMNMTSDSVVSSITPPNPPAGYNDMTLFRPESACYFNGDARKRNGVLITSLVLTVLTLVGALGVGYLALRGTAIYTRASSDITHSGNNSHVSYYFYFAFTVDEKRHEGRHMVDLITYRGGIPSGQELTIVYDPDHPENVQAGDAPTPIAALPPTGGVFPIVAGGGAAIYYTMKDYNRAYVPLKDGHVTQVIITEVVPLESAVEVGFTYTNPFNGASAAGCARLPPALAEAVETGLTVAVLGRGTQKITPL